MKKRKLLSLIIASSLFLSCLTSCEKENNNSNNNISQSDDYDETDSVRKVFNELSKSYPDLTYEDFVLNMTQQQNGSLVVYTYTTTTAYVALDLKGNFDSKLIYLEDMMYYYQFKGEWSLQKKSKLINGEYREIYSIGFDSADIPTKSETTYDDEGNALIGYNFKYIDDEWKLYKETKYLNGIPYYVRDIQYTVHVSEGYVSRVIDSCREYTYDEYGRTLSNDYYKYINNDFVFDNGAEYTYDEDGEIIDLITTKNVNDEKTIIYETKTINGVKYYYYYLLFNPDGTILSKTEYTNDEEGRILTALTYKYVNREWIYDSKTENTYDENGTLLTSFTSQYKNNEWIYDSKIENTIDEEGNILLSLTSNYINNDWVYDSKIEYTYNKGRMLTAINSNYIDNDWAYDIKTNYIYREGEKRPGETTFEYINDEWFKTKEFIVIKNKVCWTYQLSQRYNNTYRIERTYNNSGYLIIYMTSDYIDGEWIYDIKEVYEVDSNGFRIATYRYRFVDGKWV